MSPFIEVSLLPGGEKICVNIEHIIMYQDVPDKNATRIVLSTNNSIGVNEDANTVKNLIAKARTDAAKDINDATNMLK